MKYRTALVCSLALHVALGVGFITWPYTTDAPIENTALHSFLYSAPVSSLRSTKVLTRVKPLLTHTGLSTTPMPAISTPASSTAATSAETSPNIPDALVQLLHNAIQAKQRYPDSALAMQREGIVRVTFILMPDGTIKDLTVLHSSSTQSLDKAALDAINQATPFQGVTDFIHSATRFQLDVGFVLP